MATTTMDAAGDASAGAATAAPTAPLFHDFMGMARPPAPAPPPAKEQRCLPENGDAGETSVKSSPAAGNENTTTTSVCSAPARLAGAPDPSCSSRDSERASIGCAKNRVLQSHGSKSAFHRPDIENARSSLKKRDGVGNPSDNHRFHFNPDPTENTRSPKMAKFESMEESRGIRAHAAEDILLAMQRPASGSCSMAGKRWESPSLYGPSRLGKMPGLDDKMPSTTAATSDNVALASFSRAAADEGSRTGLQGSGIASLVANGAWASASKGSGAGAVGASASGLLGASRSHHHHQQQQPQQQHHWFQGAASSDSAGIPSSRHMGAPASSQLTIFYGGNAHVFDDVSPEKAEAIIGLAGSSGRSWSTTYSHQARSSSLQSSAIPSFVTPNNT
eukprot:TRINITY_DN7209_c0_g2_i1.p1 TRINITY_DN7209_c0_g2~~TRINITY_DN7209_c0_g2_i1.p1  ORF type:complete len:390 (-),score=61.32 TRINITY_DN7209_c0_g2_i1:256-1425(-)